MFTRNNCKNESKHVEGYKFAKSDPDDEYESDLRDTTHMDLVEEQEMHLLPHSKNIRNKPIYHWCSTKEVIIGLLVVIIISLLIIIVTISTTDKSEEISITSDSICYSEQCIRSAASMSDSMDTTIDPCDDFYQYACGNWQKDHPLPEWSHFIRLSQKINDDLLKLLNKTQERNQTKLLKPIFTFFHGCINTSARNKAGYNTFKSLIKEIGGWPLIDDEWDESKYDWISALIVLHRKVENKILFGISVEPSILDNTEALIYIENPFIPAGQFARTFSQPIEDKVDIFDNGNNDKIFKIAQLLKGSKINFKKWAKETKRVENLENQLNQITSYYNLISLMKNFKNSVITIKELYQYKGIDWIRLLNGIFSNANVTLKYSDRVFVTDHHYFSKLSHVIGKQAKRTIANYIASKLSEMISLTTTEAMEVMASNESIQLASLCLEQTIQTFPNLISRLYVDKLFNIQVIDDMRAFVNYLKEAFHELLEENKWMDNFTKDKALSKLKAISVNIASPDFTLDDKQLELYSNDYKNLDPDDFLKSYLRISEISLKNQFNHLRTPFPKGHWPHVRSAIEVNAFYDPLKNAIYFPAAIAHFPYYQNNGLITTNLGAIGTIIGHEITHGFDDLGRLFNEKGDYANWWSDSSYTQFSVRSNCFVDQYNNFGFDGVTEKVNGKQTLGENIADNGGLRQAFRALQIIKRRYKLKKLPGSMSNFTDEQIFFLSFANQWCSKRSPKAIENLIEVDEHSPEKARVSVSLSNFDEFSKAFNCKIGSNMNRNDKCVLW